MKTTSKKFMSEFLLSWRVRAGSGHHCQQVFACVISAIILSSHVMPAAAAGLDDILADGYVQTVQSAGLAVLEERAAVCNAQMVAAQAQWQKLSQNAIIHGTNREAEYYGCRWGYEFSIADYCDGSLPPGPPGEVACGNP